VQNVMNVLKTIDRIVLAVLKALTITLFLLLSLLVGANVLVRFVPVVSLHWFDEIVEMLYAGLVFYGAAALWITRGHFSLGDWIGSTVLKGSKARCWYRAALEVMALVFAAVFFYYSLRLTILAQDLTNVFAIPKRVLYSCMPVAGAVMIVYSIRNIILEITPLVRRKA
jgi:TRAP-type C4-dicarboxylate transport system permease small subunit